MKRLGTVLHISTPRGLIVRGNKPESSDSGRCANKSPKLNSVVLNKEIKQIGKVSGIIGPVEYPYIYVKLSKDIDPKQQVHVNDRVYVL
ncbi:MAG: Gar1/Naf1 family protein [Methanosarcinaceae archaeon]|nr:Gar1/Naf1 family protein [Methanosarcinaceae archaeon]